MKSGFSLILTLSLLCSISRPVLADTDSINLPFLSYTESWAEQYGEALAVFAERIEQLQMRADQEGVSATWQTEVLALAEDMTAHLSCRSEVLAATAEAAGQAQCSNSIASSVNESHNYIREWLPAFLDMPLEDEFELVGARAIGSLGLSQSLVAYSHVAGTLVCTRVPGGMLAMGAAIDVHGFMSAEVEALSAYIEDARALPAITQPDLDRTCGPL